jgi:hypothetical protein
MEAAAASEPDPPPPAKVDVGGPHPLPVSGTAAWSPSPPTTLAARALVPSGLDLQRRSMVVGAVQLVMPGAAARSPSPPVGSPSPLRLDLRHSAMVVGAHLGPGVAGSSRCPPLTLAIQDPPPSLSLSPAVCSSVLLEAKSAQRPPLEGYFLSAHDKSLDLVHCRLRQTLTPGFLLE